MTTGAGTPLSPLLRGRRQRRLCAALGLDTVEQFLAAPKELLERHPDGGRRTCAAIVRRLQRVLPPPATAAVAASPAIAALDLLPASLLQLRLTALALPIPLRERLQALGCNDLGAVFALPAARFAAGGDPGSEAARDLRACLDHLFSPPIDGQQAGAEALQPDWATLKGRLLAPLPDADRELLCHLVGLGGPPHRLTDLARRRGTPVADLAAAADQARVRLHDRSPSILCRMRFEIERDLQAFEGALTGDRLAVGSLAHLMGKAEGDLQLPLRFLAFCFPADFHLQEDVLCTLPPRQFRRLLARLRALCTHSRLPVSVQTLVDALRPVVEPLPRGLLLHLLRHTLRLAVQIDAEHGETVAQGPWSLPVRLRDILLAEAHPLQIEDIVFHYRERHRSASHGRILTQLRADPTFLQIAERTWSLREWHGDELEEPQALAQAIAAEVNQAGTRRQVQGLLPRHTSERTYYLVLDCLRRDARVRYLGRGEVCAAGRTMSAALEQLLKDFRRAGGDVVLSLFLQNQPESRRRLVGRLLHWNRLFLQPNDDRIDVLTNYPFNQERLDRLRTLVDGVLAGSNGHAPLATVLEAVNATDLGGGWLSLQILGEVLRRNCGFDLLPGQIVADPRIALVATLLRQARSALREARLPLTVEGIVAARPELAGFDQTLRELLPRDPLVHSRDGAAWQVV